MIELPVMLKVNCSLIVLHLVRWARNVMSCARRSIKTDLLEVLLSTYHLVLNDRCLAFEVRVVNIFFDRVYITFIFFVIIIFFPPFLVSSDSFFF